MSSELPKSESKDKVIFLSEEEASIPSKVYFTALVNLHTMKLCSTLICEHKSDPNLKTLRHGRTCLTD